ncbi:MAG: EH signature domain-containing protein [Burkholderiales bacterium]
MRTYLGKRSSRILEGDRNPQWAESLQQHKTLLGADPCMRYGGLLLAGDRAEVDELREVLNISDSSWFMRKLYLAQVRAAVAKPDADFLGLLYRVLDLLQDNELIRDEGLALVLNRFARLRPPPLAIPLRDSAVNWWGNPWLQSNAMRWGRVSPEARAMVSEWLKLEFIEAFFTLLAEEHSGDNRRLEFWARYVNSIEDIRFALGADARENRSADFQALRRKMAGLIVPLQDGVRSNNAFIMRMGPLVVVEFSGYSNACYGYDINKALPFSFDMPVVLPKDVKNSLKHSGRKLWLKHQDGVRGFESWEERFEAELSDTYNIRPERAARRPMVMRRPPPPAVPPRQKAMPAPQLTSPGHAWPATAAPIEQKEHLPWEIAYWKTTAFSRRALLQFATRFGIEVEDLTKPPHGGNLWVRTDDAHLGINAVLMKWGFEYKNAKKGWWWRGR